VPPAPVEPVVPVPVPVVVPVVEPVVPVVDPVVEPVVPPAAPPAVPPAEPDALVSVPLPVVPPAPIDVPLPVVLPLVPMDPLAVLLVVSLGDVVVAGDVLEEVEELAPAPASSFLPQALNDRAAISASAAHCAIGDLIIRNSLWVWFEVLREKGTALHAACGSL
jgi:hypothetical protein